MAKENIEVLSTERRTFPPSKEFSKRAHIKSMKEYEQIYRKSVDDPEKLWGEMAEKNLTWFKKWDKVLEYDFYKPQIKWFSGGKLNVTVNCLDRFIDMPTRNKAALIWDSDSGVNMPFTYQPLSYEVNRFANVLREKGVKKGDRVTIYLPMIPELSISMLACARIGAIHSVVFGGFSAKSLRDRIQDCQSSMLITADEGLRGGRFVPLKANADEALHECPTIKDVIVVQRAGTGKVNMEPGRDTWWHEEMADKDIANYCEPEMMDAEDPLFILYTSGSTGKPKGVLHTTAGYLLFTNLTFKWIFDYHEEDIHFCTADIGWVTGHSYILYGPLSAGATSLMFEGIPTYPDPGRFWDIVDKHRVNIFYTAPTAIRALMKEGESWVKKHNLSSLRVLGTVGEPINPEAWMWYHVNVGKEQLPIVDTWWQTETGGILITPLPGAITTKPGSATLPLPGIFADIVDETGKPVGRGKGGILVIKRPWPAMLRTIWGDPERYKKTYYPDDFKGKLYLAGDGASTDEEGYFRIVGRIDDVLNVSGHRLGTMEIESALVANSKLVAEAAVVGRPDDLTGEAIVAFVVTKGPLPNGEEAKKVAQELRNWVAKEIGPIARPKEIRFGDNLPKTRSGKIMRRLLRSLAKGEEITQDVSTLENPAILEQLKQSS